MGLERPGGAAPVFGPNRAYETAPGVAQHHGFHNRSRWASENGSGWSDCGGETV